MSQAPPHRYRQLRNEADRRRRERSESGLPTIQIGMATCGIAAGAQETRTAFEEALAEAGVPAHIRAVGCCGHCYAEPVVIIDHPQSGFPPIFYPEVNAGKARMLAKLFLKEGDPRLEHILGATVANDLIPSVMEFPRFNLEHRLIMERCGRIDPEDIYDYIAEGGYEALADALGRGPEEVIAAIEQSGLRGRGGAGFATGRKWALARAAAGPEKYVICNADEGDPGAYMDRTLLESNPHQIIEGMIIGAHAVGAGRGIIYVRAEYPLAVRILTRAVDQAREIGLLGPGILGSALDFDIEVFQGSGAFVCGEETALIQSIEGFRGMPVHRPPYPVSVGLNGRPTLINNVKTLASVPVILQGGVAAFRAVGTGQSPGTAIFSVVGSVVHPGLVEVPMGTSLRTLIFDICGGVPRKKKFKAVQIGGPSGGYLSEAHLDTPIDFDSLAQAGAMMGSGGMVVMDEDACLVDVSRFFLDFTQKESCGKCTFCRIGTRPGNIVTLGGAQKAVDNGLSLETIAVVNTPHSLRWRFLNSRLKNALKVLVGFIPAFATFALTKDWWLLAYGGAFIWFGITGLRNILQSVLGGGGFRRSPLLNWNDYVSWTRLTDSLMYTGFSVPLLDYLVKTVLLDRGLGITTTTHPVMLYAGMALANGIYLSSHNLLRGLPQAAVYGNFFRSIVSIPVAVLINTCAGGVLAAGGASEVAEALQKWAAIISKTASDIVAGFIEGLADRRRNIKTRLRDYKGKFAQLFDIYAQLELIFPDVQTFAVLQHSSRLKQKASVEARDLEKIIMIHALDLLYFWMYQPRARTALRHFVHTLSEDERHILASSQFTLQRHREISQMFLDGILGNNFPRPLSFYLSRNAEYLEVIKHLVFGENFSDPMAEPVAAEPLTGSVAPARDCIDPVAPPPN